MTAHSRPRRKNMTDRLLYSGASKAEQQTHAAIAPFDRVASELERKWGYGKLSSFVPPAMAAKFGAAMALMNEAIDNSDPEAAVATAENCIKGLHAMEAAAIAAGHQPPKALVHGEVDGFRFRIIADAGDPTEDDGIPAFTLREVAIALQSSMGRAPDEVRTHFPLAEVTKVRMAKAKPPVDWGLGGDEIPWM